MRATPPANSAADRTDIVEVAVAAAVASVIEGVASVERPTAHAKPAKGNLCFTESCADEIACHEPRHPADLVPWRQFGPASVLDRVVLVPAVLVPLLIAGVSLSRIISPTANALFRLQAQRCACRVPQGRLRHRRPQNAAGCVASNSQLRYQLGVVFDYLGFAPNLDTPPVCIVHPGLLSTRRFSIAIATDQQISKTDRTQTADTLRSLDAFS